MVRVIFAAFILLCITPSILAAQPLEISADTALEWHRDQQKIIATGNVIASQRDITLRSHAMTARYQEGRDGDQFQIKDIRATGDVRIESPDGTAFGDTVTYLPKQSKATLTGKDIRMVSDNFTLAAGKAFEYDLAAGKLSATGRAELTQNTEDGKNTIAADTLSAFFKENSANQNERELSEMRAEGSVVITTPTEVITGKTGIYERSTNIVTLEGDVVVRRGENTLKGAVATVDLNTNISALNGGEGRVTGVFFTE